MLLAHTSPISTEFSYSDLSNSDFEDDAELMASVSEDEGEVRRKGRQAKKGEPSDAELENLLLEDLSSEDDSAVEEEAPVRRGSKRKGGAMSDGANKKAK